MTLYAPPTQNALTKTLSAQLLTSATTASFSDVVGIQNKAGVMVVDRIDANKQDTPAKREYISFTGTSGNTVVGLTRGLGGSTDQDHTIGAIVEFIFDVTTAQGIYDALLKTVDTNGDLNKASGAEVTTGTDDTKIVTPKALKDASIVAPPVKATGVEIDTGTDDAKFVTSKAIADSTVVHSGSMARQAIINGNFDIWQRGTSHTTFTDTVITYLSDRWYDNQDDDGGTKPTLTRSRQLLTSGELSNSFYVSRLATNGAGSGFGANSYHMYGQKIENGSRNLCGNGKKVTLSFWAKSDIAGKKIGIYAVQSYGSGGSPTTGEVLTGTNFTLTSTLTKYTYTFTTNTLTGKTFGTDNNDNLDIRLVYQWGTGTTAGRVGSTGVAETYVGAGYIDIAQAQLCAGDVSLPFMPKSYEEELRACKRYCELFGGDILYNYICSGFAKSTTLGLMYLPFTVEKRGTTTATYQTASFYGLANTGAIIALSNITTEQISKYGLNINATVASGLTAGQGISLLSNNSTSGYILVSSEL